MDIKVIGRKVTVTEAMSDYAIEKIGNATKVMNIEIPDAEVVLRVEKTRAIPCICEVTLRLKGHTIHVEEHEEDMYAAIDVAAAKVLRQLRKYKTRVIDHRMRETLKEAAPLETTGADFDELMAELSADDEVVRVKEMEFAPMTEEEALIQIDLLGHDFFVYTDRDTNEVNVMYRRTGGGYGLLKPKAE
ncbi:MAG: ribosome-associated translation inhibitor RaiA [Slackia sp.]|nr:ribosome-associated translation inhibitor RaiA [Slackia sp.]